MAKRHDREKEIVPREDQGRKNSAKSEEIRQPKRGKKLGGGERKHTTAEMTKNEKGGKVTEAYENQRMCWGNSGKVMSEGGKGLMWDEMISSIGRQSKKERSSENRVWGGGQVDSPWA